MKKVLFLASAVLFLLSLSVFAYAHTGPLVNGEPAYEAFDFTTFDSATHTEDETLNNPTGAHKGWWYVTLQNKTNRPWASITITPGAGDLVAIVAGNGLTDDSDPAIVGNSIWASKAGNMAYSVVRGDGTRTYGNGATGALWGKAVFTFATPLPNTIGSNKVTFKIYTDNSWYTGPWADTYSMSLTPRAVPEPSSLLVLAGGLGSLAGFIRRKR